MKNPELRNIYQKLLFTNTEPASIDGFGPRPTDPGSASTLPDFFELSAFTAYTATEKTDMASYLLSFDTGTAPAVGYTLTLTKSQRYWIVGPSRMGHAAVAGRSGKQRLDRQGYHSGADTRAVVSALDE